MLPSPRTNAVLIFLMASAFVIAHRLFIEEPMPKLHVNNRVLTQDDAPDTQPSQRQLKKDEMHQLRAIRDNNPEEEEGVRKNATVSELAQDETSSPRPPLIIYTFFQEVDNNFSSNSYDEQMIASWKAVWKAKGWEPRILTVEDAKKHRLYNIFNAELDKVPLAGKSGKNARYNRLCYLRWLAMASAGGGWMADYDTVPIRSPIDDDYKIGKFTILEEIGVPSLLKGSAGEWERMALALLESAKSHANDKDLPLWSDMLSLMEVMELGKCECNIHNGVLEGVHVLNGRDIIAPNECAWYGTKRAIHFSHHAILNGKHGGRSLAKALEERPAVMTEWFEKYNKFCGERNQRTGPKEIK